AGAPGGTGGNGPIGGTGGAGGSGMAQPRFLFIGPMDPTGSLQTPRPDYVTLTGVSDDGSALVGTSTFYDTATNGGVNFYWSQASGVVTLVPPATPAPTISLAAQVNPDGF